jgi:hypothetical protein
VFVDWTVANYLDDTSIDMGQYGYEWIELPPFYAPQHSTYPVVGFSALVEHWAADYIRFINGSPMTLTYDGRDNSVFNVRLLEMDLSLPTTVEDAPLDSLQNGAFHLSEFGTGYDTLVMVNAHITSAGGEQYSYSMESFAGVALPDLPVDEDGFVHLLGNQPNPFRAQTAIRFSLPDRQHARLSVYDVKGSLVRELLSGETDAGFTAVTWDGLDESGTPAAPGVFYSRLEAGGKILTARMVLIR